MDAATVTTLLKASELPRLEAEMLLAAVLRCTRVQLITRAERVVSEEQAAAYRDLCARRQRGEPVAYLLGEREFYGLDLAVSPAVLIPRPETELLVDLALAWLAAIPGARLLDLGTGSGAIPVAIAVECQARGMRAIVTAVDLSTVALDLARANAARHRAGVRFVQSDWFDALAGERFDIIVSNPPYIRRDDPHLTQGDVCHEPRVALVSGADGLEAIGHIIASAPRFLAAGGRIALEHGYDQGEVVARLFTLAGYGEIERHDDLAGHWRVTAARGV